MSTSSPELLARVADTLEEDETLLRSLRGLRHLPGFVRPDVRARFVHQLCESPPLSDLDDVVAQARAQCSDQQNDQPAPPGASVVTTYQWDVTVEVDGERIGQIQCALDVEFDCTQLRRSGGTTDQAPPSADAPAELTLSVSVGSPVGSGQTPTLQYGPWMYPG